VEKLSRLKEDFQKAFQEGKKGQVKKKPKTGGYKRTEMQGDTKDRGQTF